MACSVAGRGWRKWAACMQARTEVEANAVKLEGDDSERSRLVVAVTKVAPQTGLPQLWPL